MNIKEKIIFNTLKYCEINKISTEELSIKIGKDRAFIDSLIKNKRLNELTLLLVDRIAKKLNIDIILLFDDID